MALHAIKSMSEACNLLTDLFLFNIGVYWYEGKICSQGCKQFFYKPANYKIFVQVI